MTTISPLRRLWKTSTATSTRASRAVCHDDDDVIVVAYAAVVVSHVVQAISSAALVHNRVLCCCLDLCQFDPSLRMIMIMILLLLLLLLLSNEHLNTFIFGSDKNEKS
jgi:hypothetical protein